MESMEDLNRTVARFAAQEGKIAVKSTNGTIYHIPKTWLCACSEYFAKALDGPFLEAKTKELHFPDTDEDTLKIFIAWLEHRKDLPDFVRRADTGRAQMRLVRLWVFCDTYMVPLTDSILNLLFSTGRQHRLRVRVIRQIAERVPNDSKLYKFMLGATLYHICSGDYKRDRARMRTVPSEILEELKGRAWSLTLAGKSAPGRHQVLRELKHDGQEDAKDEDDGSGESDDSEDS